MHICLLTSFGDQVIGAMPKLTMVASWFLIDLHLLVDQQDYQTFWPDQVYGGKDLIFIITQRWLDVRDFAAPVQDGTTPPEQIILSNWNGVQF